MNSAYMEYKGVQDKHREKICKHEENFIMKVLFNALCPNLVYKPESVGESVKQIFVETYGNEVRIPMNIYICNLLFWSLLNMNV